MKRVEYYDLASASKEYIERLSHRKKKNYFKMLAHGGNLGVGMLDLGDAVLRKSILNAGLRELIIIRTGVKLGSAYEVYQHSISAESVGVSKIKIAAVMTLSKNSARFLNKKEQLAISFVDELVENVRVSDDCFDAIRDEFTDAEIVEIIITTGFYGIVCRLLECLDVDVEDEDG